MASFNKVLLMGNLTRDPQLKFLPSQMAVCDIGVAVNRRFKAASGEMKEEVTFVDCSAFGKTAEFIGKWFSKGKAIFIEGRLKLDQWEDKNGGGKRSKLSVVIENVQFAGGKGEGGGGGGGDGPSYDEMDQSQPVRAAGGERSAPQSQPSPISNEKQFSDGDIPF